MTSPHNQDFEKLLPQLWKGIGLVLILVAIAVTYVATRDQDVPVQEAADSTYTADYFFAAQENFWQPVAVDAIQSKEKKELVAYGKELIAHTSQYLGPNGSVNQVTNGMNCQNCHLDAGTKVFGNNYGSVASMYPKFRARSGSVESVFKRVNDCIERSLNGVALDTTSREMIAIKSYILHVGSNVKKGKKATGSGFKDLEYLDRAASPEKGKTVYQNKCQSCHTVNGEGVIANNSKEYTYPPLWGPNSYNDGAGLYRLSNFAKFVKYNMPFGADHEHAQLSNDEAWDVAAYVNSQPRPHKNVPNDWPDISKKPIDHPYGPYADSFSEEQHKFGPFRPIATFYDAKSEKKSKTQ
jgi:thiosulfate dehydrogenase